MGISPSGLAGGAGLAQGLVEGVKLYYQTQNMLQEQAMKQKLANAQTIEATSKLYDVVGVNDVSNGLLSKYNMPTFGSSPGSVPATPSAPQPAAQVPSQTSMPAPSPDQGLSAPVTAQPPQAMRAPSAAGLVGQTGNMNQPQGLVQAPQAQGNTPLNTYLNPATLPKYQRQLYMESVGPQIKSAAELQTPQGKVAYAKSQTDLKNSQNEPFFKLKTEYDQNKITLDTQEAAFNLGKMLKSADSGPTAQKGLVYNYIRIENPGSVAREGQLDDLRKNPNLMQRYGDMINQAVTGNLSDTTIKDIKRAGIAAYQGAREQHASVQEKYNSMAKQLGVSPSFTNDPTLDKLDKKSATALAGLGDYKPPTLSQTIAPVAAPDGLLQRGVKNLVDRSSGLSLSNKQNISAEQPESQMINGESYMKVPGGWQKVKLKGQAK